MKSRPSARILHLSDLHTGTREDPQIERALTALIERTRPELVVASGDLTHRGRRDQHERAARFLRGLGLPLLAIPGNHDIPYTFPARFTRTFAEFERLWETTEPVYRSERLLVVGLNSVRAWRHQSGGLRQRQIDRAAGLLAEAPEEALRVVVLHHHLIGAPWRSRKKPVARRNHVLAGLVEAGAELILAGHIHQAAVSERHEFEVVTGDVRGVTVSIAPGLGQPRPNRRGEARGLHVYEASESAIEVRTMIWRDDDWALTAERRFPRGRQPLAITSASDSGPPAAATHHHPVDHEQDDRADDRGQPGADVEELVQRVGVEERAGEEAAEDRADDADDGRDDDAARIVARKDRLGDRAGQRSEDDERDDAHPTS
jgi:predicted MPP superfamily phosphohydrolase